MLFFILFLPLSTTHNAHVSSICFTHKLSFCIQRVKFSPPSPLRFDFLGVLNGIAIEAPPLQESKHSFSLYFLVPGEYTLVAAAVIEDANDILRARSKTGSPDEPIFCRGPPFHVHVIGTA
ncbi:hypothetical protein OIU77_031455 [Salix suchowensis]|uniref:Trs120/TRAPPC9 fourth Ig-like domain-containing protein n=1 Tax=Salix suchowensis TaxID=1278906 RepID=A0ABQ9BFH7_9ROSI|nr:hypothetical protein OIU77_031455 [Salix suchowensis]